MRVSCSHVQVPYDSSDSGKVVAALPFGWELRQRALERGGLRGVFHKGESLAAG